MTLKGDEMLDMQSLAANLLGYAKESDPCPWDEEPVPPGATFCNDECKRQWEAENDFWNQPPAEMTEYEMEEEASIRRWEQREIAAEGER